MRDRTDGKPKVNAKNYLAMPAGEYPCGDNLYLIVAPSGGRRWLFKYQRKGVKESMGFGSAKEVTWGDAKKRARDARRILGNGGNPKEERDEARRAEGCPLFLPYATAWRETYEISLKHQASRAKLKNIVENHAKPLHRLRIDEITTEQIIQLVLKPIYRQVETARDTRQRLKLIFDAAIADGWRKDNPADYATKLRPKLGKAPKRGRARGHHQAMSYAELPAFMQKLAAIPDLSARALEVTALTAARTAEIMHMQWPHLDLDHGLWDLSAISGQDTEGGEGTKNSYDKKTPLPRQVVAILRELYDSRVSNYVFPGRDLNGPMSNMTMLKKLKEVSADPTLTVHGFRGTFRTWAQDETDFEEEIIEHCMHHITGDNAEKAYKHGHAVKKRRLVLQAWADFATSPAAEGAPMGRVA
ncbi:site-specific integrase [Bradyrhizobium sp. SHOUNA76]|uniref:tyrosine-type recombinase/integrase n=1 Tax=Bradyrhizobium sp. SHOUNA76 TaxID=2908927 RepID=UPI001FF1AAE6|nr:site-specific integrase [Bradyrhizobium sp. SHOUNA76]MCJ9700872.1 integrase arm-type DNA-binding domain-containing protein [Bradyrhizobium sp. SHOUNA76]